jgi:ATP:ADP antiporter, AAA family
MSNHTTSSLQLKSRILIALMMALTIYALNILKIAKDTIIVTHLGAELLSTLKLFGVLPFIVIFVLFYTKLADILTRSQIYHFFNVLFNSYFILFAFFLYPYTELIHTDFPHLTSTISIFKYPLIMIGHWSFSLFYVLAELWGNVMFSLMLWQIINQLSTTDEAKKLYPRLGIVGEVGLIMAGAIAAYLTTSLPNSSWGTSLKYICVSVFITSSICSFALYYLTNWEKNIDIREVPAKHIKVSTLNSIKYVFASPQMRMLICILFCYGAAISLIEGIWKSYMRVLYPESLEYGHYYSIVQSITGVFSFLSVLLSSFTLNLMPWVVAAAITPIIPIILGLFFFITASYNNELALLLGYSPYHIIAFICFLGAMHNVLIKAAKFAFFQPSKEIAFISLNQELRTKGKGVADIAGERCGESMGAAAQWVLISITAGTSLIDITPIIGVLFMVVTCLWLYATISLNKLLKL